MASRAHADVRRVESVPDECNGPLVASIHRRSPCVSVPDECNGCHVILWFTGHGILPTRASTQSVFRIKFLLLTHTTFGGAAAKWTRHQHMNTLRQMLVWTKVGLADVLYAVGSTVTILAQLDLHTLAHA